MNSVNDFTKEAFLLDCQFGSGSKNDAILGIHEAASRLWADTKHENSRADIERRVANIIIGSLIAAGRMGMTDIETILNTRMNQLREEIIK
jgi:hypothetical protein